MPKLDRAEVRLNPITKQPWDKWEIDSLVAHIRNPENAEWLRGWSPMQVKLMIHGLECALLELADGVRVPREPTEEMCEAGQKVMENRTAGVMFVWNAMLPAAPDQPAPLRKDNLLAEMAGHITGPTNAAGPVVHNSPEKSDMAAAPAELARLKG